ncbi:MAG: hypothetical protein Q7S26_03465 [bacterium]|nr:hypothetical protein [bacterium]
MPEKSLREFFRKYIEDTPEKGPVAEVKLWLCNLTNVVAVEVGLDGGRVFSVYITSRALKHLYDKKPAGEFFCLLDCLDEIARYPEQIYKNMKSKRGDYCLVGKYNDSEYVCSVEIIANLSEAEVQIATGFRVRDRKYLRKYTLLWSRGTGNPHRNALDAPEGVY